MRPRELREFLRARPFEPIRLRIRNGQHVDVMHPEMAIVSRSLVAVGKPGADGEVDTIVHYNLIHIVEIEKLNPKSRRTRNLKRG